MKNFMPYMLPVISIILVGVFLIFNPDITGYFVREPIESSGGATIKISTYGGIVIPEDAIVKVSLDDVSSEMSYKEFIERTGEPYELGEGKLKDFYYEGVGYTGNHEYLLPIKEFGFDSLEEGQILAVRVYYKTYLISESEEVVPGK